MRVLDLFCGGGAAAEGLRRAWPEAEIVGVDRLEQSYYPYTFWQANAIDFPLAGYDFIWCSPPCQPYSRTKSLMNDDKLPLIGLMRQRLLAAGIPYCIETVAAAPLNSPIMLCGAMFGLGVYRHRYFETSFPVPQPNHPIHGRKLAGLGQRAEPDQAPQVVGHFTGARDAQLALGIEHFMPRDSLAQAIPPAFSQYIAQHLK